MNWASPVLQMIEARRRIWRESQRKRRAGLPYKDKMTRSEAARTAAITRWSKS
jgi:hypothetical protein